MMVRRGILRAYYELVREPIKGACGRDYYGVARSFAVAPSIPWETTPARDVWKDYCCASWEDMGEWDTFFPNLDLARGFQSRFRAYGYLFGIIAVFPCESIAEVSAVSLLDGYLGLDVSNAEPNSVLHPAALCRDIDWLAQPDPLAALWALPPKHFRDRVNAWGLLSRYEDAALLRDVMRSLERLDKAHQTPAEVRVLGIQVIDPVAVEAVDLGI